MISYRSSFLKFLFFTNRFPIDGSQAPDFCMISAEDVVEMVEISATVEMVESAELFAPFARSITLNEIDFLEDTVKMVAISATIEMVKSSELFASFLR